MTDRSQGPKRGLEQCSAYYKWSEFQIRVDTIKRLLVVLCLWHTVSSLATPMKQKRMIFRSSFRGMDGTRTRDPLRDRQVF